MNSDAFTATYCPEDNKLRLYVGRVPRPEYEKLRAEGWTSTPKQNCDFVATWTPERRDTALDYAGVIEDEDQDPAERAADRAERFATYLEKRTNEAIGYADRYDSKPSAHGFQSEARAERSAARHDRVAALACDSWSKAEYWQRRTAGVISHALHKASPDVRMGRIKELEAHIRKAEKDRAEYVACYDLWTKCAALTDISMQDALAKKLAYVAQGLYYKHPRTGEKDYLYAFIEGDLDRHPDQLTGAEICAVWFSHHGPLLPEGEWLTHYRLRLAYEEQMMHAQGGRAAHIEMVAGGWLGSRQIQKVNKSTATGRVVSVNIFLKTTANFDRKGKAYGEDYPRPLTMHTINIERASADCYRAPTPEELVEFERSKKAAKAAAPKKPACPLINPTDEDAARLVEMWNANRRADHERRNSYTSEAARAIHSKEFEPCEVRRMPQAFYSAHSKGSYSKAETRELCSLGRLVERNQYYDYSGQAARAAERGPAVCQIRTTGFDPLHVIILTDKPQKPLPASVWSSASTSVVETLTLIAS